MVIKDMYAEIDLMENAVYIIKEGILTKVKAPSGGHGSDEVIWQGGKVIDVVRKHRIRIASQTEI